MNGKILIFSAPSGSGKTTIVRYLLGIPELKLEFSVSATSRAKRGSEVHGKDYYYLSAEEFRAKIENEEFLEWEEVYKDSYYGSLKSEVERITNAGRNVVFDVDVKGGINIKKFYGEKALSVFVMPPSVEELEKRLRNRGTDTEEDISMRIKKARYEIDFSNQFDVMLINDVLEDSLVIAEELVKNFINS
jgi:guanylate kinase